MAQLGAALNQVEPRDFLDLRQCHRTTDRVAKEGTRVDRLAAGRRPSRVHQIRASNARGQGKAARQRFAETNQIGAYFVVLAGEPSSCPGKAGVNLVENEQRAVFITKSAQQRKKCR